MSGLDVSEEAFVQIPQAGVNPSVKDEFSIKKGQSNFLPGDLNSFSKQLDMERRQLFPSKLRISDSFFEPERHDSSWESKEDKELLMAKQNF